MKKVDADHGSLEVIEIRLYVRKGPQIYLQRLLIHLARHLIKAVLGGLTREFPWCGIQLGPFDFCRLREHTAILKT